MSISGPISAAERSIRSVFVGNIPFDTSEEKLRDLFSEVGPVINFRLVYDRESGKPKGYGFCEYRDAETASSAMRNLNGYELNGRAIRVDNAANEKNREELKNFQMTTPLSQADSPYGAECSPDKAPEAISKAVASLPPEQMFELMKQMKQCIQNNPNEARNMLLQNPQLAYALLQAQVVMKIVDPQVAMTMLHRPNAAIQPLMPVINAETASQLPPLIKPTGVGPNIFPDLAMKLSSGGLINTAPVRPPVPNRPEEFIRGPAINNAGPGQFNDPRSQQFDGRDPRNTHFDSRGAGLRPPTPLMRPPLIGAPQRDGRDPRDPRAMPHDIDARPPMFDSRLRGMDPRNLRGPQPIAMDFDQRGGMGSMGPMRPRFPERNVFDQRSPIYDQRDPRSQIGPGRNLPPHANQSPSQNNSVPGAGPGQDQEKAALIMQVLQLSDQQIALLPPEQRQSIMVLKEQIARSAENQK